MQKPAVEDEPMTIKSREFRGDTREFMPEMAASGLDIERPCHETCSQMKGRTGSDDVLAYRTHIRILKPDIGPCSSIW